jgi:hypothetical protein
MTNIPDHIRLLGLIVNTVPFTYEDNHVSASYDRYITFEDLQTQLQNLEAQEKAKETMTDEQIHNLTDDIVFLKSIIQMLESKK